MNLRQTIENKVSIAADKIRILPWENRSFYTQWLAQQYFLVRHTPKLLCAFALQLPIHQSDELNEILYHLKEETGHDRWLIKDLQKFDKSPEHFQPSPMANALIMSQYYYIQHTDPMALCGYSQFLEYTSAVVAGELADRVEREFGPGTAVFLRGHSHVDVEHAEDGWKLLSRATDKQKTLIFENLEMTDSLYSQLLSEISSGKRVFLDRSVA